MTDALRVLVVEDERDLVASITDFLQARGHVVDIATDGKMGLRLALANEYDSVVLDLGLPGMDGLDVCAALRASPRSALSILMLTARDTLDDKLTGFDCGADDYLVKPFALAELEKRLIALARRRLLNRGHVLVVGDLRYDVKQAQLTRSGERVAINPACRKLLSCLMRHSPQAVTRGDLEFALWEDSPPQCEGLKAHIHILRQALGRAESGVVFERSLIETVRGKGYRIVA